MRKPMVKTFDELNERNFTIFLFDGAEKFLGDEFVKR
jgi:hypothetical protein